MAEEEITIKKAPEKRANAPRGAFVEKAFDKESWMPVTALGKKVKSGEIKDIDEILDRGGTILEAQITDCLLPGLETDLLAIGQSKGKFGGGKKSIWRQTQKKTPEGNKPSFATLAVVGNRNGYVGIGHGKAKETVPAREKAVREAKINLIKVRTGCGSWECKCASPHSIPFAVEGKVGSVRIRLMPAPKGTRLCAEKECSKMLALAGIKDIYSKTVGHTGTKMNLIFACFEALKQLSVVKVKAEHYKSAGIVEGNKK